MSTEVALHYAYQWEKQRPNDIWFVQPTGGGQVKELSFKQAMDEVFTLDNTQLIYWKPIVSLKCCYTFCFPLVYS